MISGLIRRSFQLARIQPKNECFARGLEHVTMRQKSMPLIIVSLCLGCEGAHVINFF